jgi:hypothetical protein
VKIQQVRDIVTAYLVQGKTNGEIARSVGVSIQVVGYTTKSIKNVRNGDWDALKHDIYHSKTVRRRFLEQLQEILNVNIPAELLEYADEIKTLDTAKKREQDAAKRGETVQTAPEPEKKQADMTGEFCMRVLSNQTAQTELMKAMLADLKTYGQAILSDMQRLAATQARMADGLNRMEAAITKLDETLNDAGAALGADLKDNINANADVLRQELGAIKNNTRKRGL